MTCPMIILVNIEPEPISAEFTKCSVYDRRQGLSTEALSGSAITMRFSSTE